MHRTAIARSSPSSSPTPARRWRKASSRGAQRRGICSLALAEAYLESRALHACSCSSWPTNNLACSARGAGARAPRARLQIGQDLLRASARSRSLAALGMTTNSRPRRGCSVFGPVRVQAIPNLQHGAVGAHREGTSRSDYRFATRARIFSCVNAHGITKVDRMNRISRLYVFTALVCLGGCASSGGSSGAPEPPRDEAPQMVSRGVPPALRVPVTASGRASVRVTIEVLIDETGLPDMSTFK